MSKPYDQEEKKFDLVIKFLVSIVIVLFTAMLVMYLIHKADVHRRHIKQVNECVERLGGDDFAKKKCNCENPNEVIEEYIISE